MLIWIIYVINVDFFSACRKAYLKLRLQFHTHDLDSLLMMLYHHEGVELLAINCVRDVIHVTGLVFHFAWEILSELHNFGLQEQVFGFIGIGLILDNCINDVLSKLSPLHSLISIYVNFLEELLQAIHQIMPFCFTVIHCSLH